MFSYTFSILGWRRRSASSAGISPLRQIIEPASISSKTWQRENPRRLASTSGESREASVPFNGLDKLSEAFDQKFFSTSDFLSVRLAISLSRIDLSNLSGIPLLP